MNAVEVSTMRQKGDEILSIEDLSVEFRLRSGEWRRVVDGVSVHAASGETLGIVGESGSGKTVSMLAAMGLLPPHVSRVPHGRVMFNGSDLLHVSKKVRREIRGRHIAMIFQDASRSLNPAFTIGDQLEEAVRINVTSNRASAKQRAQELLDMVELPTSALTRYPHQVSGGQCQRVMIAMALAGDPEVIIADEPTTALDVTVQAQVLDLLRSIQRERHLTMLFITHDLGVVAGICDRVCVMYAGQLVESSTATDAFYAPKHPYTDALIGAYGDDSAGFHFIPGVVPTPGQWDAGCRFAARCDYAERQCVASAIPLTENGPARVRCIRSDELELRGVRR